MASRARFRARERRTRHGRGGHGRGRGGHGRGHLAPRPHRGHPVTTATEVAIDVWPGHPFPLGATWDGYGTNFSLFSEHAEAVELCLFDEDGEETRIEMAQRRALNWYCYLPQIGPGQRY